MTALPSIMQAAEHGFHQCTACNAIGPDAIGESDAGELYTRCARCGQAAIQFHPPTVASHPELSTIVEWRLVKASMF